MTYLDDIFDPAVTARLIERVRALEPHARPAWGKMNAGQMLAHCCVVYETVLEDRHPPPGLFLRVLLRAFGKRTVTGEKPYPRNLPTAPAFKVPAEQDFQRERTRLVDYLERTVALGPDHFEAREHPTFGRLSRREWSNLFHKHLDHHLSQFGA
jgi:hypothetical protein